MRERLNKGPCKEFVEYLIKPVIDRDMQIYLDRMLDISLAHLVMLVAQGIVSRSDAKEIVAALKKLKDGGSQIMQINPALEDLYFNLEAFLIDEIGVEIGGQLHTGRSRNDLTATLSRMVSKDYLLRISDSLLKLRNAILKSAQKNKDVVMPGYTHMQPAEPITLAHYFSAVLHALERDFMRIKGAYRMSSQSPLGSCALASTSFSIDRLKTASLLGFETIMGNSLDAVASRDYVLEILSVVQIMMNTLSRISHDLYLWASHEFAFVELDDGVSICSSIMPQKKNPVVLEHIRSKAAHVLGALVSASGVIKNTQYSHCRDVSTECLRFYWLALDEAIAALELLTAVISTLKIDKEKMLLHVNNDFSTVTELANTIVREKKISFREAHSVVAQMVAVAAQEKLSVKDLTPAMLEKISVDTIGKEVTLSEETFSKALEPLSNVRSKTVLGGPAPEVVEKQLAYLKESLSTDEKWLLERKEAKEASKALLEKAVQDIIG